MRSNVGRGVTTIVATLLVAGIFGADRASAANQGTVASPAALPAPARAVVAAALGRERPTYRVRDRGGRMHLANRRHSFAAGFGRDGVHVRSRDAALRLSLAGIGRGGARRSPGAATRTAAANRIEYRRRGVSEWFVNGPLGLEHGFTLPRRPAIGRGAVTLALAVAGNLTPLLDADRRGLALLDRAGRERLGYRGLWATDADGRDLRAWLELRRGRVLMRVDDTGRATR